MYFLIGADMVPTESNQTLFAAGDAAELAGKDLCSALQDAAYRIFNLEVPLTDCEKPIRKFGPNLIAPTSSIAGYSALGADLLTLANNHILDQGEQGLQSTISVLDKAGISHVGAGTSIEEAEKPFVFHFGEKKVGVYACAEHEFSIASDHSGGANPFDPLWSYDHVEALKREVDYVIVLYHGGKEHYRYPSPNLQRYCRRFVDKGADLVVCQHSHCIGCEEKYQGGTIVYGQGNFLFDLDDNEFWNTALLLSIDESFSVKYIPLVKQNNVVRMADQELSSEILEAFHRRSEEILQDGFLESHYREFADKNIEKYLLEIRGPEGFLYRVVNKLLKNRLRKRRLLNTYTGKKCLQIQNYLECEAHRELLLQGIKNRT